MLYFTSQRNRPSHANEAPQKHNFPHFNKFNHESSSLRAAGPPNRYLTLYRSTKVPTKFWLSKSSAKNSVPKHSFSLFKSPFGCSSVISKAFCAVFIFRYIAASCDCSKPRFAEPKQAAKLPNLFKLRCLSPFSSTSGFYCAWQTLRNMAGKTSDAT